MKFVLLKSRGGDYMVIAQNVAWLRSTRTTRPKSVSSEAMQFSSPEALKKRQPQ